jgi:SH3-like domain-containing protein
MPMRALLLVSLLATPAMAQAPEGREGMSAEARKNTSGLAVPRFMSLRATRANLRAGPGTNYPARWTFIRQGVPLEVVAEYNVWRQVRDADGETGWMDRAMLSTARTFQIVREERTLRARPDITSPPVWRAEPGVVGRIVTCEDQWCRIEVEGRSGWILREQGFGTYPGESVRN